MATKHNCKDGNRRIFIQVEHRLTAWQIAELFVYWEHQYSLNEAEIHARQISQGGLMTILREVLDWYGSVHAREELSRNDEYVDAGELTAHAVVKDVAKIFAERFDLGKNR